MSVSHPSPHPHPHRNAYPRHYIHPSIHPPIAKEAQSLVTYHRFSVTTLVGGTNMGTDKRALLSPTGCDIVVATPGRMLAHMQETPGVPQLCGGVKVSELVGELVGG